MMILQKTRSVNNFFEVHGIDSGDSLQIEMLRNNGFQYLAECRFREVDNGMIMLCKLDNMSIMSKNLQRGSVEVSEIMRFLTDLSACITEMKDYLLKPENLIIDANYILYDSREGHYRFILVPGEVRDFSQQLRGLMEELLAVMDHSDHEAVMFIYSFFSGNVLQDNFTPESFLSVMQGVQGKGLCERPESEYINMSGSNTYDRKSSAGLLMTDGYQGDTGESKYAGRNHNYEEDECKNDKTNDGGKIRNIGLYCVGGAIVSIGVIIAITYGLSGLKIVMAVAVVYIAILVNRIMKTREEEKLEEDMRIYASATEPVNFIRDVENIYSTSKNRYADDDLKNIYLSNGGYEDRDRGIYSGLAEENYETGVIMDTAFSVQEPAWKPITRLVPVDLSLIGMEGQILLPEDKLVVGRTSEEVDYCLAVPGISRRHAEIIKKGSGYVINDLNSTNGTYVNSVRITSPTWLCYGDIVSFATVDFYCV